ncbi:MAG: cytochrome c family protein [Geminicoccaceae bacterium]
MFKVVLASVAVVVGFTGAASAQDAAAGEKVFSKCKACHVIDAATNRVGPSLHGIIGRQAGTVEGYKYSEAMIQHGKDGLVWSNENLDKYLADPKGFVPKNKMAFPGLKNAEDRANVIAYIDEASK